MSRKPPRKKREAGKERVTVRSKTYGTHTRAPRGSKKKAELNDAMKASAVRLTGSSRPAKLIKEALEPFRTNFKGGLFWQALLAHFTGQAKRGEEYSVENLGTFDVNSNYPLSDIVTTRLFEVNPDMPSLTMELTCNYALSPRFLKRCGYLDGTQLTVIALFPDFKENDISVASAVLPVRTLADKEPYSFILPLPVTANSYIMFWKMEGCENGQVTEAHGNVVRALYLIRSGML